MTRASFVGGSLAAGWLLLAGTSAAAQTPAHLSTRNISPAEQARDTMNRFANCVVRARPNMAKEAIAARPGPEGTAALLDLVKRECLAGGELRMDPHIFRGAISRALYLREFGENAAAPSFAPDGPDERPELRSFGECVIRAAPEAARVFVVADVATPAERQAIAELRPAMNGCINPREQIAFTPAALEAHLAEALYRNSVAQARGTASGGGVQ